MKASVVCNSGPLIALAILDKLTILNGLYERIWVPDIVHREILRGGGACLGVATYQHADGLTVRTLTSPLDPALVALLDAGETAVLMLARQEQATEVLMDEKKGRKVARSILGLRVIGTARLLVDAKQQGLLAQVADLFRALEQAGYSLDARIVEWALRAAGELR